MVYSTTGFEDILDNCIDAIQAEKESIESCLANYSRYREELEPLLGLAARLQSGRTLTAPAEFRQVAGLRMQNLIAAHPRRKTQNTRFIDPIKLKKEIQTQLRTRLSFLVLTLVMAVVIVSSGVYYVSAKALPGETFYPAKITIEQIQLDLSQTTSVEAQLHLAFADRRIDEVTSLVDESKTKSMPEALSGYSSEVKAAQSIANAEDKLTPEERVYLVNSIIENLTGHERQLSNLLERVPEASRQAVRFALELSRDERSQAFALLRKLKGDLPGSPSESSPVPGIVPDVATPTPTPTPMPSELPASRPTECAEDCADVLHRPTPTATPTPGYIETKVVHPGIETELASERPRIWATLRSTASPKVLETFWPTPPGRTQLVSPQVLSLHRSLRSGRLNYPFRPNFLTNGSILIPGRLNGPAIHNQPRAGMVFPGCRNIQGMNISIAMFFQRPA